MAAWQSPEIRNLFNKGILRSPAEEDRNLYLGALLETLVGFWVGLGGHENLPVLGLGVLMVVDGLSGFRLSAAGMRIITRVFD